MALFSNKLTEKVKKLESELVKIKARNTRVEADKAWETSLLRKILIAIITYMTIIIVMYFLDMKNIFISALIPTAGFLLSTVSIELVKTRYIKKYLRKGGR